MTTTPKPGPVETHARPNAPGSAGAWSPADASDLYGFESWGGGFFRVSDDGHAVATPRGEADPAARVDLAELADGLAERGLHTPVLVRFTDVLESRMRDLKGAFDTAIREEGYEGSYACVYPIKVNQQRQFVEEIRDLAGELGFGLEAGSKPELLAVLALTEGFGAADSTDRGPMPIVCNGFKDDEYIETVILAHKLGRHITPVVESFHELRLILDHAERYGVRPRIGIRVKPSATGGGKWAESGGERSKFGLHAGELVEALRILEKRGMADCLKMIHCHIGSQIPDIRRIKAAVTEISRVYCELVRLGAGLDTIDVGGGMGIDYDGSRSDWDSSVNYTVEEYATDVVYRIKAVCDDTDTPYPRIITESGRSLAATSSVLVFNVLGRTRFRADPRIDRIRALIEAEEAEGRETPQPIVDLVEAWDSLDGTGRNLSVAYHDAMQARDEALSLFNLGYLSLPMRAAAERLFWAIGRRVWKASESGRHPELADEAQALPKQLSDIYFCNFSLFQSLPDSWAIDQIFPIMPIHRLDEKPKRRAILADITCDSDGQVDRFGTPEANPEYKPVLELHEPVTGPDGSITEPYYLAVFLVGAYQEVLGDLHNLFGDTHAVHVSADDEAGWRIDEVVEGDTVREVLGYLQYDADALRRAIRRETERAVRRGDMSVPESRSLLRFYESGLEGYTYLE